MQLIREVFRGGQREAAGDLRALGGVDPFRVLRVIDRRRRDHLAVERGDQVVVGVNRFTVEDEIPIPTMRIDPQIESAQVARVQAVRARRDAAKCQSAIAEVERRAHSGENLMPAILQAVEAHATVGEISDALRRTFGEYQESVVI